MKRVAIILCLLLGTLVTEAQDFIGCRTDTGWAEMPMFRKTINLTEDPKYYGTVDLSVTSWGYHEVYVNNLKVGDYVMQPAVSQLDKKALVVYYDISKYLHKGDNELLLWVGQGWGRIYGAPAAVKAVVNWHTSKRYVSLVATDTTWETSPSGYSYTDNWQPMHFGGECYDARVKTEWRKASQVAIARDMYHPYLGKGRIINTINGTQEFKGNRIVDVLSPVSVNTQTDGSILLDFGRVVTGWFQTTCPPIPEGDEITMEYLDHLEAKPPFTETDIYISDGDSVYFTNRFHMHAFRYVRIRHTPSPLRGTPPNLGGELDVATGRVSACAMQISAVDPKEGATFECSDPRLNAIHDMVKYTLSCLTFSGYMVDCPHIERMGYGGDGNSSTMTLQTIWDVHDLYTDWINAWEDAMDSTGDLPYVAPAFRTGGGPYWSGFIIKAPYRTWLNYGEKDPIFWHYSEMCRWLDFVEKHFVDGILQPWPDNGRRSWFLGDWLAPEGVDIGGESVLHVSNCFIAECLSDMVQMAKLRNRDEDAERFVTWRERLVKEIHRHFYHPESHTYANGTPLDQCYALLQGIPPDSATAQAVREQLLKDIHGKYRDHIAGGLVGVPIFTEWCIRERQADLMATILRQPDYPGYLYMIENSKLRNNNSAGADDNSQFSFLNSQFATTWESWDCGRPGKEDRSRVHNCYNGIGIWFYQALAGIRPDSEQPGYRHFFIDPQPVHGIDWVKCTKPTPYGDIKVEIENGRLKVEIPQGTTATLYPGTPNERELASGEHIIEL